MDCLHLSENSIEFFTNNCTQSHLTTYDDDYEEEEGDNVPTVSEDVAFYFEIVFWVVTNFLMSTFGTVSNIINIIVYAKMGMGDVVNISLLGLAVSDFLSVITVVWLSICYGLVFLDPPGLPFDPMVFLYVTAGWPHFMFSRTSCYITAMVSIERCLCVVAPFKVHQIVTPNRIRFCLLFIFLAFPSAYLPTLVEHKMAWKFDAKRNMSRIQAAFTRNAKEYQAKSNYANAVVFPTVAFFIVTLCVVITAQSLRRKVEWRKEQQIGVVVTSIVGKGDGGNSPAVKEKENGAGPSIKEYRVVRMLSLVCALFLVCYSPSVVMIYIRIWISGFDMFQKHHNLHIVIYSFIFLLEISNSSLNIFIYYFMSTRYRDTFHSLFRISK